MSSLSYFIAIPELKYKNVTVVSKDIEHTADVELQRVANIFIRYYMPYVSELTLNSVEKELVSSLDIKRRTLKKLKRKYRKYSQNASIVRDIINDDCEMAIEGNVKLLTDMHVSLMRSANENFLIKTICNQFQATIKGASGDHEYENIYKLLKEYCTNHFTKFEFVNDKQPKLSSDMITRLVQVWQIFDQYFKQFDYLTYLKRYYDIKEKSDSKYILSIIRILLDIGSLTPC